MAEEIQLWVRSQGKVWGPLSEMTVEMMVESGLVPRPFEISTDGLAFTPAQAASVIQAAPAAPHAQAVARAPGPPVALRTQGPPLAAPAHAAGAVPHGPAGGGASDPRLGPSASARRPAEPSPSGGLPPRAAPLRPAAGTLPPRSDSAGLPPRVAPDPAAAPPPPPPPRPRVIQAAPVAGRLEEFSPFRLYYLIAAADASGRLSLGEGTDAADLWFKQGTPHAASSAAATLGAFLVSQGALQEVQLADAMSKAPADPIFALIASGQLNPAAVFPLIQQHALGGLQRALALEHGPFAFDPAELPPPSGFPLGQRWELLAGAARRLDRLTLERRLGGRAGQGCRLIGSISELKLTAQELRLLSALDGSRSLAALVQASPAEAETLLRVVLLLSELDRLEWVAVEPTRAAPSGAPPAPEAASGPTPNAAPAAAPKPAPAAAPKPAAAAAPAKGPPVAPKAAPAPTAAPKAEKEADLVALIAALSQQTHFERIGIPRAPGAHPQLKALYFQLAKRYHPDMLPPDAPPRHHKLCEDIVAMLNESYALLGDDAARAAYLEELQAKDEGLSGVDIEAILRAEEDFQRAVVLIKNHKLAEGLAMVEACLKLNEKEGEFYAWRGYARFLLATDKKAQLPAALADVQRALRLSPRCTPAHLLEGQMAKLVDDVEASKRAYKRALDLDPNNVEAQRELRLFEQRKK